MAPPLAHYLKRAAPDRRGVEYSATMRLVLVMLTASLAFAQQYDLLLQGGHLIDAKNKISAIRDVAIAGNKIAAVAAKAILLSPRTVAGDLRWATPDLTGRTTVSLEEALTLLHVYQAVESYRGFAGLAEALVAEDDARRYVIEPNVPVETPDGATVCAIVVRPRANPAPLPTLLQFTIYADSIASMREALLAAPAAGCSASR